MTTPHLKFEFEQWRKQKLVCGMDEVGRGAFAGPLVVGAIVLKPMESKKDLKWLLSFGVKDSKLVNVKRRKLITELLQEYILFSTVQYISVDIINTVGIGKANKMGFSQTATTVNRELKTDNVFFLTDAFEIESIERNQQKNIIHGDATVFSIAAASILAKVNRDAYMEKLGIEFPEYGFAKHKGYGTRLHRDAIKKYGSSPHHRTEFIKNYI